MNVNETKKNKYLCHYQMTMKSALSHAVQTLNKFQWDTIFTEAQINVNIVNHMYKLYQDYYIFLRGYDTMNIYQHSKYALSNSNTLYMYFKHTFYRLFIWIYGVDYIHRIK